MAARHVHNITTGYPCDVPSPQELQYPARKQEILSKVPLGGYWRDLPLDLQKSTCRKAFISAAEKQGRRDVYPEMSQT